MAGVRVGVLSLLMAVSLAALVRAQGAEGEPADPYGDDQAPPGPGAGGGPAAPPSTPAGGSAAGGGPAATAAEGGAPQAQGGARPVETAAPLAPPPATSPSMPPVGGAPTAAPVATAPAAPPPLTPARPAAAPPPPAGAGGTPAVALHEAWGPAGEPASTEPAEWEPGGPWRLDLRLGAGAGMRLDDAPLYPVSERAGGRYGGGLALWLSRRVSLGLGFQHLHLGGESTGILPMGSATISRDLNTLWGSLTLYPLRGEQVGGFLRIALGPAWQSGQLDGWVWSATLPGKAEPLRCEGSDTLNLALGTAVGADITMTGPLRLLATVGIDSYRLDDAPLDGCLPGAGSAMVLGLGTTVAYGIGL